MIDTAKAMRNIALTIIIAVVFQGPSFAANRNEFKLKYHQKHYDHWINYFSKKSKQRFIRHLKKGDRVQKLVESIFESYGLPPELFFVGLIESGFHMHAKSHASAVGPWQFMRKTGIHYGLKVNHNVDERRNIYKSTHAAARYFIDLFNIFGSWELALCAYNAGEYRLIRAIRKGNTRDYRELVEKKLLPKETIFYVPKVAAARHLAAEFKNKYAIEQKSSPFKKDLKEIDVGKRFNPKHLAKKFHMSLRQLKIFNPDLLRNHTQYSRFGHKIILPKDALKNGLLAYRRKSKQYIRYVVRAGDSLYAISKKFGVTVDQIQRSNDLKSFRVWSGQEIFIKKSDRKS